ncbi:hypothetical protein [Thermoflexus sp.]|uniref:hypothetical protein n=1 Tax=Thermoflexus sp. TaxID=1969742 RepID=UPI00175D5AA8|nr:hypothetical protein [Thermoflexus sp.]
MFSNDPEDEFTMETLAETEHFTLWRSTGDDGQSLFHLELGNVSIHLTEEEWEELVELVDQAVDALESGGLG